MPEVGAALAAIVITLETTTIVGVSLATIAIDAAIIIGTSLLEQAILGGPQQPKPPHARRENFRQDLTPRERYYGRVKVGGPYAFLKVGNHHGSTTGALFQLIVNGHGVFDGFEEYWLSDGKVTFVSGGISGSVLTPKNYVLNGEHFVAIGPKATADQWMASDWPDQWTEAFKGNGLSYSLTILISPTAEHFTTVYPAGLPTTLAVVRASRVFDPRDPSQDALRPSTWHWRSNWALCVMDALWHPDGLRLPYEMIEPGLDVWSAAADYCDTIRPTKNGGSEPMYRIAGGYELTDQPKNWFRRMLDVADGRIVLRGDGVIVPDVGGWREPELTLTDAHIIGYMNFSRGRQKPDIRNVINATFIAPEYGYTQQQADPWINEASIDIDGQQQQSLDLSFCPSHAQARVRMKIESFRQDPEGWCGTVITNAYGLKALTPNSDGSPKRFLTLQLSDLALSSTFEFQFTNFDHKTGNCTFTVQEMTADASVWNPEEDEGDAPLIGKDTSNAGVENPYNLAISVSAAVISATIDTPADPSLVLVLEYRSTDDAIGDDQASWTAMTLVAWGGHTDNLENGFYDVRARLHNSATPPDYSDPLWIRGIQIGTAGDVYRLGAITDESGNPLTTQDGRTITEET